MYNTNQRKPFHSINFITAHDGFRRGPSPFLNVG
jgi:hypothetical protein